MIKKISFIFAFTFFLLICPKVNALTINSTYRDMTPTNGTTTNLLSFAENYDSFKDSKFVVFSDSSDSYYIVWSRNLKNTNNIITGSNIEYLRYYRVSSSVGYQYLYGTDSSFRLNSSYHNTSNIDGYGFISSQNQEYEHIYYVKYFLILITGMIFIIVITNLKRSVTV